MPPLLKFIVRRMLTIPITLLVITAVLYGIIMFTPADQRAMLYFPSSAGADRMSPEQMQRLIDRIIIEHGLDQPYPVQYMNWLGSMLRGEWGWSPVLRTQVLDFLVAHTPVTVELTLYSVLLFIPLGLVSGVQASRRRNRLPDHAFRLSAFMFTSIPPFILGLIMMSFFYVGLRWFAPGRLGQAQEYIVESPAFKTFTGLLTIDGLLNGRLDIVLDALKHLVMPVLTLSAFYWATLSRVTRASMLDETNKEYIIAAEARGIPSHRIAWRHMLRNALVPALTSSGLAAASLIGGVYVVEVVFNLHGVSELFAGVAARSNVPDAPSALGFGVYSVFAVLLVMFILDVIQAIVDPRLRERLGA